MPAESPELTVSQARGADTAALPIRMRLLVLLGGMMFLEYAAWGAWMPVLGGTLSARGMGDSIGNVYGALWLALAITPFLGGQIADRWMPSQYFLAASHLLGAGAAFVMANQTTPGGFLTWMFIWALIFAPSLGVTNSIALYHIDRLPMTEAEREREFSWVRTAGTVGWIVAAFVLLGYGVLTHADPTGKTGALPEMQLTGIFGIAMAVFCLLLPNTPPSRVKVDPLAFRKAFTLFKKVPGFTVFMAISFFAATEFQFFYVLSAPFLQSSVNIPHFWIPVVKSISQVMEFVALALLLPLWLPKKGMKWCLLVGSFAWPLRYLIFAIGQPAWLVVLSLGLHGFGYAFVMVVQQLYVDRVSPKDVQSSAQNLLNIITLGAGSTIGSWFCGKVLAYYTTGTGMAAHTNWPPVFILPAVTTTLCAIAYAITFRDKQAVSVAREDTADR